MPLYHAIKIYIMKKVNLFIIIVLVLVQNSCAKENEAKDEVYNLFVQEGRIWANGLLGHDFTTHGVYPVKSDFIKFQGDTIIEEISWKKIYKSTDKNQINWEAWGFIREDNKKVYYKWGDEEQRLLYDFGLESGEQIELLSTNFIVDSIKNDILYNGENRKHIYLSINNNPEIGKIIWIEGIGSISGFFENTGNLLTGGGPSVLLCFEVNNELIYKDTIYGFNTCFFDEEITLIKQSEKSTIKIYPNPASNFVQIESNESISDAILKIYSVEGKLLMHKDLKGEKNFMVNVLDLGRLLVFKIVGHSINMEQMIIVN